MKCPRCQQENPPEAKFCLECATPLALRCVSCGTQLPAGAKFCVECATPVSGPGSTARFASPEAYTPKHLAERILTSRAALEGERKQVTVLFVDVSGFTSLSERLDPEEVHRLMNRAFDLMLAEVHRYEGTVNQFLGDGIMALFGAPIAHEDHAQPGRAGCARHPRARSRTIGRSWSRAALTFRARQGLNRGLVVVGSVGSDLRMDYTAVGDTTNVAARLQQASEPGRVIERTHAPSRPRLLRHASARRDAGEGQERARRCLGVVAAREARTRLDAEAARGLTPFVGRERELERAAGGVRAGTGRPRAGRSPRRRAGIGKSRLFLELRRRSAMPPTGARATACPSAGRRPSPPVDLVSR